MRYRKLRIAWSVGWGLVVVLLIVLWVRSYWSWDTLLQWDASGIRTRFGSDSGVFSLMFRSGKNGITEWQFLSDYPIATPDRQSFNWQIDSMDKHRFAAPSYVFVCLTAAIAGLPWLRWRFSLRTLLIATTLVAVGLGLIVAATR